MTLKPLDTDGQHSALRSTVLAYRAALAQAEMSRQGYVAAEAAWKNDLARCEQIKEALAGYVDKRDDRVVVTLDGGNIACLISYVDTYGVTSSVHVSFLPVSGHISGPSIETETEDPREPRYEYAGKLGPWTRSGTGTRYLAVGSQTKPTYKKILYAGPVEGDGRSVDVTLEDGNGEFTTTLGCNTNTYVKR